MICGSEFHQDVLRSQDVLIWTVCCWTDGVCGWCGGGYLFGSHLECLSLGPVLTDSLLAFSPRTSMFSSISVFWILSEPRKTQKLISSIRIQLQWQSMKTSSPWACLERLMVTSPSSKANPSEVNQTVTPTVKENALMWTCFYMSHFSVLCSVLLELPWRAWGCACKTWQIGSWGCQGLWTGGV